MDTVMRMGIYTNCKFKVEDIQPIKTKVDEEYHAIVKARIEWVFNVFIGKEDCYFMC